MEWVNEYEPQHPNMEQKCPDTGMEPTPSARRSGTLAHYFTEVVKQYVVCNYTQLNFL